MPWVKPFSYDKSVHIYPLSKCIQEISAHFHRSTVGDGCLQLSSFVEVITYVLDDLQGEPHFQASQHYSVIVQYCTAVFRGFKVLPVLSATKITMDSSNLDTHQAILEGKSTYIYTHTYRR